MLVVSSLSPACSSLKNDQTSSLRRDLALTNLTIIDKDYSQSFRAYVSLIQLKEAGFESLSNAWAYDKIPAEIWFEWEDAYATRFTPNSYTVLAAYDIYFLNKYKKNKKFAEAVINKYKSEKLYMQGMFFFDALRSDSMDERAKGYFWLQEIFKDIPNFDHDASPSIRAQQIAKIKEFITFKLH